MVVLSRHGSSSQSTNILMHHLSNTNRVVVCLINTLTLAEPTMMMFPVNGKVTRVWELSRRNVMNMDDYFTQILREEGLFKKGHVLPLTGTQLRSKNYQVDVLRLDECFYSSIPEEYYEDGEKLRELTRSLWQVQTQPDEEIYVVCAGAKESCDRGSLCVEFELPHSGNLIIPGTLQHDLPSGKKVTYAKGDLRVLISNNLVALLRGSIADQVLTYVSDEKSEYQALTQLFGAKGDQVSNSVIFQDVRKADLIYLGEKRALLESLFSCVCELIETCRELPLSDDVQLKGGVLISFQNFQTKCNKGLTLS